METPPEADRTEESLSKASPFLPTLISHQGLPLAGSTGSQSAVEPGKCSPQGQAPATQSRAGKDEGWIGRPVGKRQAPLPSFYDRMKRPLTPTQGQKIASADIFESLLIHTAAMEAVSREGAGSVTQVPIRRESGRMTLGGHHRSPGLVWPGELGCLCSQHLTFPAQHSVRGPATRAEALTPY